MDITRLFGLSCELDAKGMFLLKILHLLWGKSWSNKKIWLKTALYPDFYFIKND